jgi:predicted transposase YbfD/YdcC
MQCIVKKTLQIIIDKQCDYLVKVKGNQPNLFNAVKEIVDSNRPISVYAKSERRRGRDEYRNTSIYLPTERLPDGWCELNRIIHVERCFKSKKPTHQTDSYYISSLKSDDAQLFSKGIRGHWLIENRLHYVKDAIMKEDYIRNNTKNAPANMSIIRNIVINILNTNGYNSNKHAALFFASNVSKLLTLLFCRT